MNIPEGMTQKLPNEHKIQTPLSRPEDNSDSETNQSIVSTVLKLYEISKTARNEFDKNWDDYKKLYNGEQWKKKPASFKSAPNINIIRSTIETELPLLTDTQPGFDVLSQTPSDFEISDILSKVVQDWWSRRSMDHVLVNVLKDTMILDYGIMKVTWDEELESGRGDVSCTVIDPECLYVNPDCTDFDSNCDWVIERKSVPVGELKRLFPDKADRIFATTSVKDNKNGSSNTNNYQVELVSPVDKKSTIQSKGSSSVSVDNYATVEVLECWLKDYTPSDYNDDAEEDTVAKTNYSKQTRIITIVPQSKLLLQDTENPYKDNRYPYVRFIDNLRPRSFHGQGEVEPLAEIQRYLNKVAAIIFDCLNMMSNPIWIVDDVSGVNAEMLTNSIALVVTKAQGSEVRREGAVPLPPALIEVYNLLQAVADQQSGVNDVSQGRKPTGITAANALQTMQDAAQTRIRLKQRNMEVSLSRLGELVISRIMQFYSSPRVVKIAGKDIVWPEVFEFYVSDNPNGNYEVNKRGYTYHSNQKKYVPEQSWNKVGEDTKGLFSVRVTGGTSLPFMRQQRGSLAMELFKMKVIDNKELLDSLDWPRREQVLQRIETQTAEAAQQGAPGAPGPGQPPPMMPPPPQQ